MFWGSGKLFLCIIDCFSLNLSVINSEVLQKLS